MRVLAALLALSACALASTLVVVDNESVLSPFSAYLSSLGSYSVATLSSLPARIPSHLVLFALTSKTLPAQLSPQALVSHLRSSSSSLTLVLHPTSPPEVLRDFSREFDVDFDSPGSAVIDFFSPLNPTTLSIPLSTQAIPDPFTNDKTGTIQYSGLAHTVTRNPLLHAILVAPPTAYSGYPDQPASSEGEEPFATGSRAVLVSAFQTKDNARVLFAGGTSLFADEAWKSNGGLVADLGAWVRGERGRLEVESLIVKPEKSIYTVSEQVEVHLALSPDTPTTHPFTLSLSLITPYIRQSYSSPKLKLPDKHGVFTLTLGHLFPGYHWVESKKQVAVAPPRHDGYERFIVGASMWYVGAFSTVVAWLVIVVIWVLWS